MNRVKICLDQVRSVKDLSAVINHFDKYPLITQKLADYELFKQAIQLIQQKEHLTIEGIHKLIAIKASMNLGLSKELKAAFPDTIPVLRPLVENQSILDPQWIAGFTSGDGCFYVKILNSSNNKISQVRLVFQITQHNRDQDLMNSLVSYLNCGYINKSQFTWLNFLVTKFSCASYIDEKIIPFFSKYQIQGVKHLDFLDFVKVAEIMKEKGHLTERGLDQIIKIKAGMNKGRS